MTLHPPQVNGEAAPVFIVDSIGNLVYDVPIKQATLTLLTSASRTTTQASADQINTLYRGVRIFLDISVPGTGSITLTIQHKDNISGKYITLLAGAAVVFATTKVYEVYPGLAIVSNVSANNCLGATWRVVVTANNANAMTYSAGAELLI